MTQAQTAFFTAASLGLKNDKKRALNDVIRGIKETIDTKYADAFSVSGSTTTFSGLIVADSIDVQTLNAANLQFSGDQTINGDFEIIELTALTNPASTDVLPIVDVSADETKKVTIADLLENAGDGTAAAPAFSFDSDKNTGFFLAAADKLGFSTNGVGHVYIDGSGRMGIGTGTSTPEAQLHVIGADANNVFNNSKDIVVLSAGGNQQFRFFVDETNKKAALQSVEAGVGSKDLLLQPSGGNVGIGTSSPSVALHVNGDIRCDGVYGETGTNTSIQFPGSNVITFNEGGSEAARIDSFGRLLLGTSNDPTLNPNQKLAIVHAGQNSYTGASFTGYTGTSSQAAPFLNIQRSRGITEGSFTKVVSGDRLGALNFRGADGTNFVTAANITCDVDGAPGADDMPSRLVFSVTADGASSPTEAMRIKNSGIINIANTPVYADNAAAKTGGLVDGDVYRTSTGDLKIVYT